MDRWIPRVSFLVALALLLAGVSPAAAQEEKPEEQGGPLYPFFFIVKSKVDRTLADDYAAAVTKIVEAHQKHEHGNMWAAYAPLTGGPDPTFTYFLPMQTMGDMDGWLPNQKIVTEAHGADAGAKVMQTVTECSTSSNMVLGFNEAFSNPPKEETPGPPPWLFVVHSKVEPENVGEYAAMVAKVKSAHQEHEKGLHWNTYNVTIGGGEGAHFVYLVGMEKLSELEGWTPTRQVLNDVHGAEEATQLIRSLSKIVETKTAILMLVPSFSQLGSGE